MSPISSGRSANWPGWSGLAAAVETGTLEARVYRHWLAAAQDAERGGYHSDTFVGMVVSARKPEPGRAAIARYQGT
jgi:hypothetical protein